MPRKNPIARISNALVMAAPKISRNMAGSDSQDSVPQNSIGAPRSALRFDIRQSNGSRDFPLAEKTELSVLFGAGNSIERTPGKRRPQTLRRRQARRSAAYRNRVKCRYSVLSKRVSSAAAWGRRAPRRETKYT